MTSHTLTMQCPGHSKMLLGYFHIIYKLPCYLDIITNQGFFPFFFFFLAASPSPGGGPSPLVWRASLEQLGQRDLQDSPNPPQSRGKRR